MLTPNSEQRGYALPIAAATKSIFVHIKARTSEFDKDTKAV
jgi:hypothetical protein